MQGVVRPYVTAGAALFGASVIAVSPVAPPMPDIKATATPSVSAAMQLASTSSPILALSQLFGNTVGSVSGLFEQFSASPAPILRQVVTNQLANLQYVGLTAQQIIELIPGLAEQIQVNVQEMVHQLATGDIVGAGQTLNNTLIYVGLPLLGLIGPPLAILENTTQNIANVFAELPNQVFPVLMSVLGPVNSAINGVADIGQTVLDAVGAGDFLTAAGALVSAPIVMADAILNGFGSGVGLLTPQENAFTAGPIGALMGLSKAIADVLQPLNLSGVSAQSAANESPDISAQVVTLNVDAGAATEKVVAASVEGSDDGASASAAPGGADGSGVTGVLDEQGEEGEVEDGEAEDGADVDGSLEDTDTDTDTEDAEQAGSSEIRESLVATPGETGLSGGSEAGDDDGDDASENGPTLRERISERLGLGKATGNAGGADADGGSDAGADAGDSGGSSESGNSGSDE